MKILYDYQILRIQKYGGISRYYYDLIENIKRQDLASVSINCINNRNHYFREYFGGKEYEIVNDYKSKIYTILNIIQTKMILASGFDIIHPTYYNPYIVRHFGSQNAKIVITVYDMIHELFPEYYSHNDKTVVNKRKLIYAADHIIAISENTKKDILTIYPDIDPNKISVIYIGCDMRPNSRENKMSQFPEKFVLFVGARKQYKNFSVFWKAMDSMMDEDSDLSLVCCIIDIYPICHTS